jgi:hypothetical protein
LKTTSSRVSALNKTLLAQNQELEAQLAIECQEKDGKHLSKLFNYDHA